MSQASSIPADNGTIKELESNALTGCPIIASNGKIWEHKVPMVRIAFGAVPNCERVSLITDVKMKAVNEALGCEDTDTGMTF
jgi:hypothetical protein